MTTGVEMVDLNYFVMADHVLVFVLESLFAFLVLLFGVRLDTPNLVC